MDGNGGWVKSKFCDTNACVEVKPTVPDEFLFVRSPDCEGGACIEVAYQANIPHEAGMWHPGAPVATFHPDGSVTITSTTQPGFLEYTKEEWAAFVKGAKAGFFSPEALAQASGRGVA